MSRFTTSRLRLEARRSRGPLVLYLLGVAGAVVSVWILFHNLTFNWPWQGHREVRVAVEDAKGVVPGQQEVRAAGVRVGIIKKLELRGGKAVLTLSLNDGYGPLYRNAKLRLRPVTPLQDMYLAIESRGTPDAGKLSSDEVLPAVRTSVPVDISRVLDIFDPSTRARLDTLLTELGRGLPDQGRQLRAAFGQLGPFLQVSGHVSEALASRRAHLQHAVRSFTQLTTVLSERDRQLRSLVRDGARTVGALSANRGDFGQTIRQLAPTLARLQSSLQEVHAMESQLDPALRSLEPVAQRLPEGLQSLRSFSEDARPALATLETPVRRLRSLARSLRPTAAALGDLITTLRPQAPDYASMTARIKPCLPHVGKFFWRTLSLTKMGDAYGVTPRADLAVGLSTPDVLRQKDTLLLKQLLPCWQGKVAP